jgi:hypothetical protein
VISTGRNLGRRVADLMIAAVAIAQDLSLYTTNPTISPGWAGCWPSCPSPGRPLVHGHVPEPG